VTRWRLGRRARPEPLTAHAGPVHAVVWVGGAVVSVGADEALRVAELDRRVRREGPPLVLVADTPAPVDRLVLAGAGRWLVGAGPAGAIVTWDLKERGRRLEQSMRDRLARADPKGSERPRAAYLTAGGFTAGSGTLIDAMMRAAGFENLTTTPGFGPLGVETIALQPPARFILGFFDKVRADWRGAGRHPVVRRVAEGRTAAALPAAVLTCPAWFAADGAAMMAEGRP
jgi:hypothetical protein